MTNREMKQHFMKRVKKTEACWLWTGSYNRGGYGRWTCKDHRESAHRASFRMFKKNFNPDLWVLHKCDNPQCVRPSHLFQGTRSDNMKDCVKKGRFKVNTKKGSENHLSKLTESDVIVIRDLYSKGVTCWHLAQRYEMSERAIYHILKGTTWSHVKQPRTR